MADPFTDIAQWFAKLGMSTAPQQGTPIRDLYAKWYATVKSVGGRVTRSPTTGKPVAAYPLSSGWVTKVNTGTWPLPDEYSQNGQTAYYKVPASLAAYVDSLSLPTESEVQSGSQHLMDQWGIPDAFRGLSKFVGELKNIGIIVLVVGGVYYALKRRR